MNGFFVQNIKPLFYLSGEDPRFYKRGTANILVVSVAGYNPPLR